MLGGGLLPGTLCVVYGATGIGKTHLGLTFAHAGVEAEGAPGILFDMNARGDSQQHHEYAARLYDWSLQRWRHTVTPMAAPFPPPGEMAARYCDALSWTGKLRDYQVPAPDGGLELDWNWKAEYNHALYTVRPFVYFHLGAGQHHRGHGQRAGGQPSRALPLRGQAPGQRHERRDRRVSDHGAGPRVSLTACPASVGGPWTRGRSRRGARGTFVTPPPSASAPRGRPPPSWSGWPCAPRSTASPMGSPACGPRWRAGTVRAGLATPITTPASVEPGSSRTCCPPSAAATTASW